MIVAADGRTVYVAGQVAYDSTGAIVGAGDFRAQADRVFANLRIALASAGATFADVVKTTTSARSRPAAGKIRSGSPNVHSLEQSTREVG